MKKVLIALGVFVFSVSDVWSDDCGCEVGKTEPETYEYCKCTDPIEFSAEIKTTCDNQKSGSCITNFVVRNDGINPPDNPSGPGKITCDHTNHFDVTFQVTLKEENDSPTAGDGQKTASDGGNGGGAKSSRASSLKAVMSRADEYGRGTPMWRVGLGQDASGNPSGQVRIEPAGLYSDEISPAMLRVAVASGKIDVWYHTDWVTNIVASVTNVEAVVDSSFPEQILAKECFVTVSTNAEPSLAVRFYHSDQVEPELTEEGAYALKDGAEPYVEYLVTRPEASERVFRTRIAERRSGQVVSVVDFAKETSADGKTEFNVYEGGGIRSSQVKTLSSTSVRRTERSTVVGNDGSESVTERSYLTVGGRELLTNVVRDPDGLSRGETYEYGRSPSSPDYGRITRHVSDNGLVTEYTYDGAGRTLTTTVTAPALPVRRTVCSYAPLGVRPHCPDGTGIDIADDNGSVDLATPRIETEYVGDTPVSKTLRFISLDTMQHRIIEEVRLADPSATDIAAQWDSSANVRTYTDYMPKNDCKPCSELPSLVKHADGTIDRYAYSAGEYEPGPNAAAGVFTDSGIGEGDWFRTVVTHYAAGDVEIPNVTTRDVKIEIRSSKKILLQEQYVCTAPGEYARVSWTATTRDDLGQETLVVKSDGTRVEKTYAGRRLASMTDAEGLTTTYTYDALGRVIAETKSGGGVRPDTTTTTTYDPEDRVLSRTVTAGDLSETETYAYDALGRTVSAIDSSGIETRYLYAIDSTLGLEMRSTIRAFGTDCAVTNTVVSYADGRIKETRLNGVVKTAYEYGPNWTKTYEGPAGLNSPRWSCSYEDAIGRTICETRPGFRGALLVTSNEYNTANQLVATRSYAVPFTSSPSPLTFTLISYNSLGERNLTVSDMNLNGQIDWNDTDRIVSNDTRYVVFNGDWWRESSSWQTRQNGSSELTLMGRSRTRLTGLGGNTVPSASSPTGAGAGLLTSETRSCDPLNNETVACSYLDRSTHTTTRTTTTPASPLPAETVVQSGLTISTRSSTGVMTTYAYDALGRQISQTDGRGNTSHLVYDAQGRVAKTIDALGHETTYAYDALGRQITVTDPLGHSVTTTYDAEGRVTSQRGATYPVDYAYDVYGNKVAMTTYRNESDIPMVGGDALGAPHAGDTTRWLYDEPSGCMTNKLYADGKGPSYDFTPDGKLARRVWARGIATDYTYDNAGQLVSTTYSDNTPTITMSYDRVGNLINATTAGVVTNLYAYDLQGHCTNEWQNDFNLTRYYDTLGRSTGYAINGTRQTTIAYDSVGRIATMCMAEGRSGVLTASNENEFVWSYLPNTDLKASLLYPNGLTASWQYDANNQLLQVCNVTPTNVISQFDYTYDAAGRRTAITKSGSAFGDLSGSIDSYTYNARSELTSARRTKNGQPIPGFSEDFDYDPIGNRRSSATYNEKGEAQTSTYQANNLNQYTSRTTPGYAAVRGEADPNATVTVNENPTFRLGSYYFGSDLFDNSSSGGLANLETYATLAQTAANGEETDDLVSATTNQVYLAQSPEAFAYDDDGNQTLITTKTGLWRVTYNGENRPIRWERDSDNTTLTMTYDHMGRRRQKNDQRFFYEGYLQVADNAENSYAWDCTEPVATRPLAWNRDGSSDYYTHDGNKNVSEVVDIDDIIAAHYEYAPFGAVTTQRGESAASNPWRFSSEYVEDDTATVHYNYRHFEPMMGRWVQRDPIGEKLDVIVYAYVNNQPQGKEDILGLFDDGGYVCVETQGVYEQVPFGGFVYKEVCVRWEYKKGHKDFPNNGTKCPFDYTKEDDDWKTAPWWPWGIGNHFKKAEDIEGKDSGENDWDDIDNHESYEGDNLIRAAISGCDAAEFESLMHQLQDTHTHYDRGWRTWKLGHLFAGTAPDWDDYAQTTAWDLAKRDTEKYVKLWNDKCKLCCESECIWRRK